MTYGILVNTKIARATPIFPTLLNITQFFKVAILATSYPCILPTTSERMEFSMSTQSAQNTISKVPELSLASYIARNIKVGNNI